MLITLLALTAFAQDPVINGEVPTLNGQIFRPAIDSSGLLWTDESRGSSAQPLTGRFLLSYVNDPLVYESGADVRTELISSLWQLDLMGAWTYKRLRLGVDAPIYVRSVGDATGGETGLGDIALDLRGTLLDRREAPVGLALAGRTTLPTTTVDGPLGHGGVGWEVEAIVDAELGERWLLAANLGTRGVPGVELENLSYNDQLITRLGAAYTVSDASGVGLELVNHLSYKEPGNPAGRPTEIMLGGWQEVGSGWRLRGGLGRGLNRGIGASKLRVVAALAWEPRVDRPEPPRDLDGDGLVDPMDACPEVPEDLDGVADEDGCPEPTVVTVRVLDTEGVDVPGATWTLEDASGKAGGTAELIGGFYKLHAEAGGYIPATTSVQVPDAESHELVAYLHLAADPPGTLKVAAVDDAGNAVPEATWSTDGGLGGSAGETVTLEPGTWTVTVRAPGYRSVERTVEVVSEAEEVIQLTLPAAKVMVVAERIEIKDSVYFETAKAVIKTQSNDLLDEVAQILIEHPELARIRVEGHTDSRGNAAYNKDLSERRAAAVVTYLVSKGVEAGRLESEGFGEEKPLRTEETPEAWEVNRRVDFFVVERSD